MIHAKDLRTSNLIYRLGNVSEVDWSTIKLCAQRNKQFNEDWKPIPLTPEWLVKFGFGSDGPERWLHGEIPLLIYWSERLKFYYGNAFGISLDYVHQLQNLYLCLTGKELRLKEQTF